MAPQVTKIVLPDVTILARKKEAKRICCSVRIDEVFHITSFHFISIRKLPKTS